MSEHSTVAAEMDMTAIIVGVLGVIGMAVTGIIANATGKGSAAASLTTALSDGFKTLQDLQNSKMETMQRELTELHGEVRRLGAHNLALRTILRQHGIDIPRDTITAVVFEPFPSKDSSDV